jgi:hypothetical protein
LRNTKVDARESGARSGEREGERVVSVAWVEAGRTLGVSNRADEGMVIVSEEAATAVNGRKSKEKICIGDGEKRSGRKRRKQVAG